VAVEDAHNDVAGASAESAAAASRVYYTTSSGSTNVRSGPGTGFPVVRTLPAHTGVTISCQAPGTKVAGPYGTSDIWDRIGAGQFVSDAYVYTGSDGYVAERCS
jgi:uncharacterized protein YraI